MSAEHTTTLAVGRTRIRVVTRPGTSAEPPLVLCNGIGAPLEALTPFVNVLDPRITAVRFDLPGAGSTPRSAVPVPFAALAQLVATLVHRLGHGCTGWATAGSTCSASPGAATPRRYRDASYAGTVAGHIYGGEVRRRPERAKQLLLRTGRPPSGLGYLFQLAAGLGWTSLPFLPLIRQRTLILAGTDDPIIPLVNARLMNALLPHAQLHTYDDGHLAIVTRSEELAPVVSQFLLAP